MNEETEELPELSEVELLLPWYATGRLDAADKARVEAFLAAHPEARRRLTLVLEEQEQTVRGSEALGQPSPQSIDRLMASLASEPRLRLSIGSVWGAISRFLAAPTPFGVRWAAAAAALLLLVQAAAIGSLILQRTSESYRTASGPRAPASGITLLVTFADEAKASAIASLLAELDAQIIEGPKPGGVYRIRLMSAPKSEVERQQLVRRLLLRQDVVRMVLLGTD